MAAKTLHLLRHAKSEHKFKYALGDHARPLNERGKKSCLWLREHFQNQHITPELVLCSDAQRTSETAKRSLEGVTPPETIKFKKKLYLATTGEMIKLINKVDESISHLMIVGHNPGIHQLASFLCQKTANDYALRARSDYPTACLTRFAVDSTWADLSPDTTQCTNYILPS